MTPYQQGFSDAAALCRRYALNLSELPQAQDAVTECADLLDEAAELAPTIDETGEGSCQHLLEHFFPMPPRVDTDIPWL